MSLSTLKKSNSLDKLLGAVQADSGGGEKKSYKDDRLWKPVMDKSGNGYAVIRFLPAVEGEDMPWAKVWNHAFQGPTGQWYIENSLTTVGQNDPVSEMNSAYWNSGVESDKEIARKQKRKLQYFANIYVVEDSANPENEGKVMLYRFGKKIFDKCMEAMQPAFDDEVAVNPFDFWTGAFFELKIRNVAGYRNYDKSDFKAPTAFLDGDEVQLEAVYNGMYDLNEFIIPDYAGAHDPKYFKSYDELKNKLETVLGLATGAGSTLKNEALAQSAEAAPVRSAIEPTIVAAAEPVAGIVAKEEDDTLSYFAQMAAED